MILIITIKLLSVDLAKSFTCHICGPSPTTIICDGTLIGFQKDLIQSIHDDNSHLQQGHVEKGSCHSSRIMLRSRQSRQLLQQYSGLNPGFWNNRVGVGLGLGNNRETIENNALMASSDYPALTGREKCRGVQKN